MSTVNGKNGFVIIEKMMLQKEVHGSYNYANELVG